MRAGSLSLRTESGLGWIMTSKVVTLEVMASIPIDCDFWSQDDGWKGLCKSLSLTVSGSSFEDAKKNMSGQLRCISKNSCVTILGEVRGELLETVCAFTLGGRSGFQKARNLEQNHRTDRCYDDGTDNAAAEQEGS